MTDISNKTEFYRAFVKSFGVIPETSLSGIRRNRIRLDLGGDITEDVSRVQQAVARSSAALDYCFEGKGLWLRIILWSDRELSSLKTAGLKLHLAAKVFEWKEQDYDVILIWYKHYSFELISPIVNSIINWDLCREPSANITCYFIDFTDQVVVNIYDDRGCDIHSPNEVFIKLLKARFKTWLTY